MIRILLTLAIAAATAASSAPEAAPVADDSPAQAAQAAPNEPAADPPEGDAAAPVAQPASGADTSASDTAPAAGEGAASPVSEPAAARSPASKAKPAAPAVPEPLDDQARFLAGLPVAEDSPLYPLQQTRFWKAYAKKFDADWEKLRKERLDAMGTWSAEVLRARIDPKAAVYYLFGGPDFLSVPVLYPEAPVYILGGLEPLGRVPRLQGIPRAELEENIRNLRFSLNSIIRLSFFRTNDMREDLRRTQLSGVLPLLFVLVARADAKLLEVARVSIDGQGELKELGSKEKCAGVPGLRLRIQRRGQEGTQELYYFQHDVSNGVIQGGPGFFAFFERHAPANTFLKAASFLLHRKNQFALTREFLLAHSKSILQDDSGLPFASLAHGPFDLTLFGTYLRPRSPFTKKLQPDMAAAFQKGPVEPLPFLTGYRRVGESNLVLATSRPKAAASAQP